MKHSATDFFKDRHGRVVIVQALNPPLLGWLVLTLINHFVHSTLIALLATLLLCIWAILEIWSGASPFRRLLGLAVLAGIVMTRFG